MSNVYYSSTAPRSVRSSGQTVQNRLGGAGFAASPSNRPSGSLRPVEEDPGAQWTSGSYSRPGSHMQPPGSEKGHSQLSLVGQEYSNRNTSPRDNHKREHSVQSANDKGMTYEDVQELIKAERVWWSEASERQVKNLETEIDSQVNGCLDKVSKMVRALEEKLTQRFTEDKKDQQVQFTRLRNDLEAHQALVSDLERSHNDSSKSAGMVSEVSISRVREEMNSRLNALREEIDNQREEQSKRLLTQTQTLQLQLTGLDQATSELRRESAEMRGQDIKLRTLEGTVAQLTASCMEVQERTSAHAATLRNTSNVDSSISDLQKEISSAKGLMGDHDSRYSSLEKTVNHLRNEATQLQGQLREADAHHSDAIADLQSKLMEATEKHGQASSDETNQIREEAKTGIRELTRQVAEVADKLSVAERLLRQDFDALRLEHQQASQNEQKVISMHRGLEEHLNAEIARSIDSERTARMTEVKEVRNHVDSMRANLEVALEQTTRTISANRPAELEVEFRELQTFVRSEEQARGKETMELRQACKAISATLESRCQDMQKTVEQERESLESRMTQVRSNCDALFSEVEANSKAMTNASKERAEQDASIRKEISRLSLDVSREKQEREAQHDLLRQQYQEQRADLSESRAHFERELAAHGEELRNLDRLREQVNRGSVKVAPDGSTLTTMDATMVEAALGKERANQAAKGELPSQIRADVMQKVDTLEADVKTELSTRLTSLDAALRGEMGMRVETLETDLRCEIAARINAVESELRIAAPGASHMVARVQSVEEDVKHIEGQVCKHEGLVARVEALESGLQSVSHTVTQTLAVNNALHAASTAAAALNNSAVSADQPFSGSLAERGSLGKRASYVAALQSQTRQVGATPRESRDSRVSVDALSSTQSSVSVSAGAHVYQQAQSAAHSAPRSRSLSVQRHRDPSVAQALPEAPAPPVPPVQAEREFSNAFPTFAGMQATSANKTPSVQPTPPATQTPNPAPSSSSSVGGATMNQDLKESLVSLVSKVHSALVGKSHSPEQPTIVEAPGDTIHPNDVEAFEAAQAQQGSGAAVPESREVFKQALQELIEENRALQEETANMTDGAEEAPPGMVPGPVVAMEGDITNAQYAQPPMGMQQLPPGRISVAAGMPGVPGMPGMDGAGGAAPPPVAGSLNLPTPASLAASHGGSVQMPQQSKLPFAGGSAALPLGHAPSGNMGVSAMGGSMRVPMPGAGGMPPQTAQPGMLQQQQQQQQLQQQLPQQPPATTGPGQVAGGAGSFAQPNPCAAGMSRGTSPMSSNRQQSNPASFNNPLADKARSPSSIRPGAAGPAGPGASCRMNQGGGPPGAAPQQLPAQMYRGNPGALPQQQRGRRIG